ncbi:phospholipase D-like domain-containing protein [Micropruina sonneratiae]|uniref:phospholipase D-like domain-containing protein n=1 Tax=Micropruina sonneratiae TaxID=2986940 RepID=UPI0022267E35|nr:phospholipase D-like domain-containing protein [Micropruina sp. KQZ13P-5]MCW3156428.1 phospholipase D-like domain-containing protein [Micropruina sp. KQZ13P-5]
MRLLKRLCPSLALMLVLTLVPFVAGSRPAAAAAPTLGPVFNDTDRWAISKNITRMVKATPRGATIRIAQYRIASSDPHLLPALRKAVKRGVNVRIVLDKSDRNRHPMRDEGLAKLAALIKKKYGAWGNRTKPSFIVLCTNGCIGTAYSHNKFYLFSRMGSKTKVVVQSTANVAKDNATEAWNASLAVAGRTKLYGGYVGYFSDLAARRTNESYYRTVTDGPYKAYFFPRKSSTGDSDDPKTDTIYRILDEQVRCTGNTKVGTSVNHRTIIRIAVWGFTREEVARKLRSLADRDCWIDVAINKPGEVSAEVLRLLANHPRINVDDARSGGRWMHAKYLLVEGNYAGRPDSKLAFVGSHNFTLNALRHNDETWLKIDRASVHDAFRANFRRIMKASPNYPF